MAHRYFAELLKLNLQLPGRGIELCWEATRASTQAPEWLGRRRTVPSLAKPFWPNSVKSRRSGGRASRGSEAPRPLMRSKPDYHLAVEQLVDCHLAPAQRIAPARLFDLKNPVVQRDGVVRIHAAFVLDRKHPVHILTPRAHESAALTGSQDREPAVEFRLVLLAEEAVCLLHRRDLAQSQLLRQAALPGAVAPLHPPARLRRVRRNHLDPQLFQRPSKLRDMALIHLAASLRRHKEMTGPIAVQGAEYALLLDHLPHRRHQRARTLFIYQLRVIDLAGSVVQDGDQIVVPPIPKPGVLAGVDVQHHPRQWPARPPPPVLPSPPLLAHQPSSLQRLLYPGVADPDAVLLGQLFVEMPHVEIEVLLPI